MASRRCRTARGRPALTTITFTVWLLVLAGVHGAPAGQTAGSGAQELRASAQAGGTPALELLTAIRASNWRGASQVLVELSSGKDASLQGLVDSLQLTDDSVRASGRLRGARQPRPGPRRAQ